MTNYAHGPTSKHATGDEKQLDAVLTALASPVRRRIVAEIVDSPQSTLAVSELAERLGNANGARESGSVESLLIDFHHRHLPILSDAGLIAYDTDTRRARSTVDLSTLEADIHRILEFPEKDADKTDALFEAIADPRRRGVLESLAGKSHAVTVESIAVDTSRQLRDGHTQPVSAGDWKRVQALITHTDLPLLADAGLIEYDRDSNLVRSRTRGDQDTDAAAIVELSTSC